ncbi:MAG: hypothetical protein OEV37_02505 [Candidatus Berkelbacteria bacterium]|nr:hypothetical protein [Candidatus Berkelbacteria bacterium]
MIWSAIILAIIIALLVAFIFVFRNKAYGIGYYSLFSVGLIWIVAGIPMENYLLSLFGIVFFVIGLQNKDRWEEEKISFSQLSEKAKRERLTLTAILALTIILSLVFYLLNK